MLPSLISDRMPLQCVLGSAARNTVSAACETGSAVWKLGQLQGQLQVKLGQLHAKLGQLHVKLVSCMCNWVSWLGITVWLCDVKIFHKLSPRCVFSEQECNTNGFCVIWIMFLFSKHGVYNRLTSEHTQSVSELRSRSFAQIMIRLNYENYALNCFHW